MTITATATTTKVSEILNTIDLKEYSVLKARHEVPASPKARVRHNAFETAIGDTFEDTCGGFHIYGYFALTEDVANEVVSFGINTLMDLVSGTDYLSAWMKLDLQMLCSELEDEHDISLADDWFETNTYVVDNNGIATLQTA